RALAFDSVGKFTDLVVHAVDFRWEGANLVERGTNPDGSTFLEIWTPLPGAAGATGSWSGPDHHVVRVGWHVVHVDSRAGTYWRL
ncbi:hypothetical protein, partial [Streptomyces sp. NPDC041003]|uniref:hypothetical protein n=1 Tax=Streptomyces sp. NPDC041003 TaxID=3155730 RepID=UPI0033DDB20C